MEEGYTDVASGAGESRLADAGKGVREVAAGAGDAWLRVAAVAVLGARVVSHGCVTGEVKHGAQVIATGKVESPYLGEIRKAGWDLAGKGVVGDITATEEEEEKEEEEGENRWERKEKEKVFYVVTMKGQPASSGGMDPLRALLERRRVSRLEMRPDSVGILPPRLFQERSL